MNIKACW